jgi:hypothetical protein
MKGSDLEALKQITIDIQKRAFELDVAILEFSCGCETKQGVAHKVSELTQLVGQLNSLVDQRKVASTHINPLGRVGG